MTIVSTAATTDSSAALVAEFAGGASSEVEMMIGIGLVKDSDAVFFQYIGDNGEPHAIMLPSGKPLTRMQNIVLTGISVADDIGEYNATKLNLFVQSSSGTTIMLTAGLQTIWAQCVVGGLMALLNGGDLTCPFTLDTWKGNSRMKPCFAAIRVGNTKMSDNEMYTQLSEARSDKDHEKTITIMRDAVEILGHAVNVAPATVVDESVREALLEPAVKTVEAPADF